MPNPLWNNEHMHFLVTAQIWDFSCNLCTGAMTESSSGHVLKKTIMTNLADFNYAPSWTPQCFSSNTLGVDCMTHAEFLTCFTRVITASSNWSAGHDIVKAIGICVTGRDVLVMWQRQGIQLFVIYLNVKGWERYSLFLLPFCFNESDLYCQPWRL